MSLYVRYAAFFLRRPDLAVKWLETDHTREFWYFRNHAVTREEAKSLMVWHLLKKLPNNRGLHHGDRGWSISHQLEDGSWGCWCVSLDDGPLETLFHFFEENPDAGK